MNIGELLKSGSNVTIAVSGADLKEFGMSLIAEAKTLIQPQQSEKYLTSDEVGKLLNVSANTLWRWNRDGYLKSIKVGRTPMYRQSDIDRLREGKEV